MSIAGSATRRRDLGVPSCGGAFTSFKRVVSRRGGREWFVFDFGAVRTESRDHDVPRRAKRIKQERDRHEQYKAQYEAYVEKKIEKAAGPRKKKAGRKKGPGK